MTASRLAYSLEAEREPKGGMGAASRAARAGPGGAAEGLLLFWLLFWLLFPPREKPPVPP